MSVDLSKLNAALVIICGIVIIISMLMIFFAILLRKRHNYFLQEKELIQVQYERVLLQSQIEIQEDLFTKISSEIHDNIGQILSLVRLSLNTLGSPADETKLQFTDEMLGKAISDLRNLAYSLNTEYILNSGFCNSVQLLLTSLERTNNYTTTFDIEDDSLELGDGKTLILFRIIQEAVNNIIKHAEATAIKISITSAKPHEIRIQDNGKGMDIDHIKEGIGLKNMQLRSKMIGAKFQLRSSIGHGTSIIIEL